MVRPTICGESYVAKTGRSIKDTWSLAAARRLLARYPIYTNARRIDGVIGALVRTAGDELMLAFNLLGSFFRAGCEGQR
jgi:hypothetical protein